VSDSNTFVINVPDMSCQHCKMRITEALQQVPGIRSIEVDLESKKVSVEAGPGVARETLIACIEEEGFQPQ